jgi:hypothetical protein
MLIFLVAFVGILLLASYGFLFPALRAAENATPSQKRELTAYAALVLMLVLVCLVVILIVTFRVGQYFFPRHREPPTRTEPFDAWAESARRLQLKDDSDLDDPDDAQNDPHTDHPDIPP